MTEEQLAVIEARALWVGEHWNDPDELARTQAIGAMVYDIPTLVAEVRRLRADEAERCEHCAHWPVNHIDGRACEWGPCWCPEYVRREAGG